MGIYIVIAIVLILCIVGWFLRRKIKARAVEIEADVKAKGEEIKAQAQKTVADIRSKVTGK
ncbi:hypothetical protein dsx2_2627 [Desulfovibrio sp. X2]|uniref:hypothetical protein n=1 Tax=Desulfovibrio sp. X2 TaxID=941449 RepID=UPI0003587C63|nr:hypothetical protein [Desulfovibrio sp. X2]EPR42710.1 hypothetical protein dsx2_2627 [Desulfovibrio sp. X2]